jgi:drug/metabolite transporter (DMT)-like permease
MNRYVITAFLTIVLISIGQILFKLGANTLDTRFESINMQRILTIISNKYLLCAIFIYILSTIFWIYTLSKLELSFAYFMMSLSFPIILLLSVIFLHEPLSVYKISSVGLIILANIILVIGEKT